jgi:hypothetical protein
MKDMLWIEDIVKNTLDLPFFTNSLTWLVCGPSQGDCRKNAFTVVLNAQNGSENMKKKKTKD